ncbi:hypothetical protein RND71_003574 [Anisodus tanguticus]|uniref:Uncharacterized protein n=1 Tax=Anisodus tanguticus TaxID=243964 RepID=A0AAE1STH9_9SOLA|nr:hypothetical protein RND71_003574 [Anisodus tanguticus]
MSNESSAQTKESHTSQTVLEVLTQNSHPIWHNKQSHANGLVWSKGPAIRPIYSSLRSQMPIPHSQIALTEVLFFHGGIMASCSELRFNRAFYDHFGKEQLILLPFSPLVDRRAPPPHPKVQLDVEWKIQAPTLTLGCLTKSLNHFRIFFSQNELAIFSRASQIARLLKDLRVDKSNSLRSRERDSKKKMTSGTDFSQLSKTCADFV